MVDFLLGQHVTMLQSSLHGWISIGPSLQQLRCPSLMWRVRTNVHIDTVSRAVHSAELEPSLMKYSFLWLLNLCAFLNKTSCSSQVALDLGLLHSVYHTIILRTHRNPEFLLRKSRIVLVQSTACWLNHSWSWNPHDSLLFWRYKSF